MFVYTDTEYYLYNTYTKKFLGHPLLFLFELNSRKFENFPTYTHDIKNALKLQIKKPISGITAAGSNNLVLDTTYITGMHSASGEPEPLQPGEEFVFHVGEENGVHTHLFVTGTAISRPTFQDILEDGIVCKPLRMFYLSKGIYATGGTDLFSAEQRGQQNTIEAFTPMALVDGVSGNHVDFPSDSADDSANQQAHVAGEIIDDYIFQWMLVPVVVYGGTGCTASAANEILVPQRNNVFKNSAGAAFFSRRELCEAYNVAQNINTVVGWQCLDRSVSKGCFSVTKSSLVVGKPLHKNVGECLEECDTTRDHGPATPATTPGYVASGYARRGEAVAISNVAESHGGAAVSSVAESHEGTATKSHGNMKDEEGYEKNKYTYSKKALGILSNTGSMLKYVIIVICAVCAVSVIILMARRFLL